MKQNMPMRYDGESRMEQTQYWINIGGMGISPDMLELVGFWPESVTNQMRMSGINTSQSIEQVYGGILRFRPLGSIRWRSELDEVLLILHKILQIKRHINDYLDTIPKTLQEEWHNDDDRYIPSDLPNEVRKMLRTPKHYVIAESPNHARQVLDLIPIAQSIRNRIGYFAEIYARANKLFSDMLLETVSMSLTNLSLHHMSSPRAITLEELADARADSVMEGEILNG